jgi:hypothetical protein
LSRRDVCEDENDPFVRTGLCRTVASALSMGLVVRK